MTKIFVAANRAASVSSLPEETPLCVSFLNRIKRSAKKQNPRFRPFKLANEMEWFILLLGKSEFAEFKNDPDIKRANEGNFRDRHDYFKDPLFLNDDLVFNGVIIREISEDPL